LPPSAPSAKGARHDADGPDSVFLHKLVPNRIDGRQGEAEPFAELLVGTWAVLSQTDEQPVALTAGLASRHVASAGPRDLRERPRPAWWGRLEARQGRLL